MSHVLLVQLPVPQLNFGHFTGNIPFGAACLRQAAAPLSNEYVEILPQMAASYMGDAALLEILLSRRPDIIGFTLYMWNISRTLHLIRELKAHYSPKVMVGGPEVTDDNPLLDEAPIDFRVYGEGESLFAHLLSEPDLWSRGVGGSDAGGLFTEAPSPYLSMPLMPEIENTMLLETMRGCPYACAYCFYSKSRRHPIFKEDRQVLTGIEWALAHAVREVYFLDPSLNCRPGLKSLLKKIAGLNRARRLSLISEIRADAVDDELAELLASAGFTWFEIGLQSTNPNALTLMRRRTDVDRFLKGVQSLKKQGITTAVDLIVGLPGDDLAGFDTTLQFVLDHNLHEDIQVFPLSILPGTEFRREAGRLGLSYEPRPPYTVIQTPTFSRTDMAQALLNAENRLDVALYPMPDLDLSWRTKEDSCQQQNSDKSDIHVVLDGCRLTHKVWLHPQRSLGELARLARSVTHPYQLLVPSMADNFEHVARALTIFTEINPHTPMELVFFEPPRMPAVQRLLKASRIERPHYLDGHLRPLFDQGENRAIILTVATTKMKARFDGPMQRHIHWWRQPRLPSAETIHSLEQQGFEGILIDSALPMDRQRDWQDKMIPIAGDLIHISFAWIELHIRWLRKTAGHAYCFEIWA